MTAGTWLAFALGAGLGAPTRYLLDTAIQTRTSSTRPVGTLTVNAVGSFVLGVLTGLIAHDHVPHAVGIVVGTGFCGSLTTFSTFAFETVRFVEDGAVDSALRNIALNTTISIALAALGYATALQLR